MTTRQWLSRHIQQVCLWDVCHQFPWSPHLPIRSSPSHLESQCNQQIFTPYFHQATPRICGMVNNHHRFIPGFAHTMVSLYSALLGKPKSLLWEVQHEEAFMAPKKSLPSATILSFPTPDAPLFLSKECQQCCCGCRSQPDC